MALSVLIIGPPGRLRDALCAVLRSFPNIRAISTADNVELGTELAAQKRPSLLIFDENTPFESNRLLLGDHARHAGHYPVLVIAKARKQALQARRRGADAVLISGFSTDSLFQTLLDLDMGAVGERSNRPPKSSQKQAGVARPAPVR